MNIITIVLDFFYEMFYGWNSAHIVIVVILLALFCADNSKRWRFREGELIATPLR